MISNNQITFGNREKLNKYNQIWPIFIWERPYHYDDENDEDDDDDEDDENDDGKSGGWWGWLGAAIDSQDGVMCHGRAASTKIYTPPFQTKFTT